MKNLSILTLLSILLVSCAPALTPAPTSTAIDMPQPTATFTPEPTATPEPVKLSGLLFLDANGSGLRDNASFICPETNAAPESLEYYFPEVCTTDNIGQLVTVQEPSLQGISVCYKENCAITGTDGTYSFMLSGVINGELVNLKVTDPNAETPALALRYINKWNKAAVIPAYSMNGVDVPEQNLNDTKVIPLKLGLSATAGAENQMGLMQGFLTYPFLVSQYPAPRIQNHFDLIGYRIFDDAAHTFFTTQDGLMINYNGKYTSAGNHQIGEIGVSDSHTGYDFNPLPEGNWIVNGGPTSTVSYLQTGDEFRVEVMFPCPDPSFSKNNCATNYGHLAESHIVYIYQQVYPGQIIGVSGRTGVGDSDVPQLHYNFQTQESNGNWGYYDMFRYTITPDPTWNQFWGNPISLLIADNIFIYPNEPITTK